MRGCPCTEQVEGYTKNHPHGTEKPPKSHDKLTLFWCKTCSTLLTLFKACTLVEPRSFGWKTKHKIKWDGLSVSWQTWRWDGQRTAAQLVERPHWCQQLQLLSWATRGPVLTERTLPHQQHLQVPSLVCTLNLPGSFQEYQCLCLTPPPKTATQWVWGVVQVWNF